jgi:hypothetical protein
VHLVIFFFFFFFFGGGGGGYLNMQLDILFIYLFIYSFIQVYCPYATLGYERPTLPSLTDINIHSDTQAEPRKLSSLTLYIDLWQEGKPALGQNPPVISLPMVIFRRIGVRADIRTQNPVLSNTRIAKMVPLSHLRRHTIRYTVGCVFFILYLLNVIGG